MRSLGCCGRPTSGLGAGPVELPAIPGYVTAQQCDARAESVAHGARILLFFVGATVGTIGFLFGKSMR